MEDAILLSEDSPQDDLDLIKKITVASVGVILVIFTYFMFTIIDESINSPASLVQQKQSSFHSLIQYDMVKSYTGNGVSVCIVDSGIELSHPDLKGFSLADWSDFIANKTSPYDDNGHGTMMAGILIADGGLTGVARDVDLYVAKALAADGTGSDSVVAQAIDWCISNSVNIISLSLGGAANGASIIFGDDVENAVDDAYDAGIVVVAAAGNDGENDDGDVASPGTVDTVICVGGVDSEGNLWSGSSVGDNNGRLLPPLFPRTDPDKKPEVVAPGHDVPVIMPEGGWGLSSGTSAATVFVTGAIAILFEQNPDLKNGGTDMLDNMKQWIMDSSKMKNGQDGHDNHYGYGLIQYNELINAAS